MWPPKTSTPRMLTVGSAVGLAAGALVGVAPSANAASPCLAANLTTGGAGSADLQGVIDAASPGDSIQVEGGLCRELHHRQGSDGCRSAHSGNAESYARRQCLRYVLKVASLTGVSMAQVTLTNLKITNGRGGIRNNRGVVTLTGSTSVAGNVKLGVLGSSISAAASL